MIDWNQITLSVCDRERLGIAAEPRTEVRYIAMRFIDGHWSTVTLIPQQSAEWAEDFVNSIYPGSDYVICPVALPAKEPVA